MRRAQLELTISLSLTHIRVAHEDPLCGKIHLPTNYSQCRLADLHAHFWSCSCSMADSLKDGGIVPPIRKRLRTSATSLRFGRTIQRGPCADCLATRPHASASLRMLFVARVRKNRLSDSMNDITLRRVFKVYIDID